MAQEITFVILFRIADAKWYGLASRVQLGFRHTVGIAHDGVGGLPVRRNRLGQELISVSFARYGVELICYASRRVIHAVSQRKNRENHKRADLNDIDGHINRRRTVYAP